MPTNINRVVLTGNLTRDPELRQAGGTTLCKLGIAVNGRKKDATGSWVEDPNFFDVTVWGAQGENVAQYMRKGSPIAVSGRLKWRKWTTEDGANRTAVEIVADDVQFLPEREGGGGGGQRFTPQDSDFKESYGDADLGVPAGGSPDDDIPF